MKNNKLERFIENACVVLIVLMFLTVSLQIIGRYLLPKAPDWTEELGRYLMPWLVAVGAGVYLKQGGYRAAIEVVMERLPKKAVHLVNALASVFILIFLVTISYFTALLIGRNFNVKSAAMNLPMSYIYLAVLVTGLLMIRFFVPFFFEQVKSFMNKD